MSVIFYRCSLLPESWRKLASCCFKYYFSAEVHLCLCFSSHAFSVDPYPRKSSLIFLCTYVRLQFTLLVAFLFNFLFFSSRDCLSDFFWFYLCIDQKFLPIFLLLSFSVSCWLVVLDDPNFYIYFLIGQLHLGQSFHSHQISSCSYWEKRWNFLKMIRFLFLEKKESCFIFKTYDFLNGDDKSQLIGIPLKP